MCSERRQRRVNSFKLQNLKAAVLQIREAFAHVVTSHTMVSHL